MQIVIISNSIVLAIGTQILYFFYCLGGCAVHKDTRLNHGKSKVLTPIPRIIFRSQKSSIEYEMIAKNHHNSAL